MTEITKIAKDLKKKCNTCKQWFPRTEEHFYRKTERGRSYDSQGKIYLRGSCKECEKEKRRRENRENPRRGKTAEEQWRYKEAQKARRAATNRILDEFEDTFKLYYAQELEKRGVRLKKYRAPELRQRAIYHRKKEDNA